MDVRQGQMTVRSGLLMAAIKTLRLRADAPWPSQIAARRRYRKRGLRLVAA